MAGMKVRSGFAKSTAEPGGVDLYYEDMGDPNDPAVLLIMGLGAQMLMWRTGFCEKLVSQGLRVIRYDNRDVGLSTKLSGKRVDSPLSLRMARSFLGLRSPSVYTLEDVADDAAALLDHLNIDTAHIVGGSMGGMIAQVFASRYGQRTKSLAVIFSSNNQSLLPPPGIKQLLSVITGPPANSSREAIIDNAVRINKINGSPGYPTPEEEIRAQAAELYDRAYYPAGIARHFDAILGSGSLRHHDKRISAPTVVIHGRSDRLMRPFGGRAVARAIDGARLVLIDGMGHELPEPVWDEIVGELKTNFAMSS
ncbi:hydrolase [Mycolicibacterium boenickei]|uniref:Hydrolase n=2 Tax=Mycolicibacterium boenickei TaxID=146017 RepID=A0ABN5ZKG6_9MYCO|nr:hydrolase [Mycolicibacterium boenickei]